MNWYLHACPSCGGDLHDDVEDRGWVTCFMCARSFPAKELPLLPGRAGMRPTARTGVPEPVGDGVHRAA